MEVMDEVFNTVTLVVHTKLKIPGIIHLYVPHPFVVTGASILYDVVVRKLVHHVHHLYVVGRCEQEGCVHTLIFYPPSDYFSSYTIIIGYRYFSNLECALVHVPFFCVYF